MVVYTWDTNKDTNKTRVDNQLIQVVINQVAVPHLVNYHKLQYIQYLSAEQLTHMLHYMSVFHVI